MELSKVPNALSDGTISSLGAFEFEKRGMSIHALSLLVLGKVQNYRQFWTLPSTEQTRGEPFSFIEQQPFGHHLIISEEPSSSIRLP
jgi:hypothetical protein